VFCVSLAPSHRSLRCAPSPACERDGVREESTTGYRIGVEPTGNRPVLRAFLVVLPDRRSIAQERTRCEAGSSPGTLLPSRAAWRREADGFASRTIPLVGHAQMLPGAVLYGPIDSWSEASASRCLHAL